MHIPRPLLMLLALGTLLAACAQASQDNSSLRSRGAYVGGSAGVGF